jgi:hypothetical protein
MSKIEAKQPLIIEFAGMPNSGKTTTIDILEHYFCRKGYEVLVISETAGSCPLSKKSRVEFTSWIMHQTINSLLEQKFYNRLHDLVLIDRGIFDSQAFVRLMCKEINFPNDQAQLLVNYVGLPYWSKLTELVSLRRNH